MKKQNQKPITRSKTEEIRNHSVKSIEDSSTTMPLSMQNSEIMGDYLPKNMVQSLCIEQSESGKRDETAP
jgi:hypothetical protein